MNGYEFYVMLVVALLGMSKRDILMRLILREIERKSK